MEITDELFNADLLENLSDVIYRASINGEPILFLGVVKSYSIGKLPEVWILTSTTFEHNPILLREFRKLFKLFLTRHPIVSMRVEAAFTAGNKFARFFRFKPVATEGKYIIYEVNTLWQF